MVAEPQTLLAAIAAQPERPLLILDGEPWGPQRIQHHCLALRQSLADLQDAAVALQLNSVSQFLLHLIALDGFAAQLVLLPPCMVDPEREQLLAAQQSHWLLQADGPQRLPTAAEPMPLANTRWLFTTSGTSGSPKVFAHTLATLGGTVKRDAGKRQFCWGLLYQPHRFAGMQVVLQAILSGSLLVTEQQQNVAAQIARFRAFGVNCLSATPSQWRKLLMQGDVLDCALQQITLGGEIADQAVLSALARAFPQARLVHVYASTEAGVGFAVGDGLAGFPAAWLQTAGAAPVAMRLDEQGCLWLKSARLAQAGKLAGRLDDQGYLNTEDCVYIEGDRAYFSGRASGVINVGGNKVFPEVVEAVLRQAPAVADAVVWAKASPIMGQLVAAKVQLSQPAEDEAAARSAIVRFCRERLQRHQVPASITIVGDLAISDAGKLARAEQ